MQLRTWTVGATLPLADVLSGELHAGADVESFAFDIDGGDTVSSSQSILNPGAPATGRTMPRGRGPA